jgi:hypothetical protein
MPLRKILDLFPIASEMSHKCHANVWNIPGFASAICSRIPKTPS